MLVRVVPYKLDVNFHISLPSPYRKVHVSPKRDRFSSIFIVYTRKIRFDLFTPAWMLNLHLRLISLSDFLDGASTKLNPTKYLAAIIFRGFLIWAVRFFFWNWTATWFILCEEKCTRSVFPIHLSSRAKFSVELIKVLGEKMSSNKNRSFSYGTLACKETIMLMLHSYQNKWARSARFFPFFSESPKKNSISKKASTWMLNINVNYANGIWIQPKKCLYLGISN